MTVPIPVAMSGPLPLPGLPTVTSTGRGRGAGVGVGSGAGDEAGSGAGACATCGASAGVSTGAGSASSGVEVTGATLGVGVGALCGTATCRDAASAGADCGLRSMAEMVVCGVVVGVDANVSPSDDDASWRSRARSSLARVESCRHAVAPTAATAAAVIQMVRSAVLMIPPMGAVARACGTPSTRGGGDPY
jgi:hypothetical protein